MIRHTDAGATPTVHRTGIDLGLEALGPGFPVARIHRVPGRWNERTGERFSFSEFVVRAGSGIGGT